VATTKEWLAPGLPGPRCSVDYRAVDFPAARAPQHGAAIVWLVMLICSKIKFYRISSGISLTG